MLTPNPNAFVPLSPCVLRLLQQSCHWSVAYNTVEGGLARIVQWLVHCCVWTGCLK